MTRRIATAAGLAVVLLAAIAGFAHWRLGPRIATETVAPSRFARRVVAEGVLSAVHSTQLNTPTDAAQGPQQIAWLIADGSPVIAGTVVARFDRTALEQQLRAGTVKATVAGRKLDKAEAERDGSLANRARDAEVAEQELEVAQRFQATDDQLHSRLEIVESRIDTELARERCRHAEEGIEVDRRLRRAGLELLGLERRQAEVTIDQARRGLEGLVVTAPHTGVVILSRDRDGAMLRVGDTVWPGRPIATLPDLSKMEAEAFVLEADAGGLAVGQAAQVTIEGRPERPVAATVARVDPVAAPRLRGVPVQFFRTTLTLEHTDPDVMKPGQRIRAEIVLAQEDSALTVPLQSVFERDGKTVVYRRHGRRFDPVEVSLGTESAGRAVVLSGLDAGDEIALSDPTSHASGTPATNTAGPPSLGAAS